MLPKLTMRDVASIIRNGYDETRVKNWAENPGVGGLLKECIAMIDDNYVEGYES